MRTIRNSLFPLAALIILGFASVCNSQEVTVNDKDINVIHFEALEYPNFARAAHIEGVVVVRVVLDEHGDVTKVSALSGKEPLVPSCIANVKKWTFQPNTGKVAIVVYNFTMPTGACGSVRSLFMLQGANFVTITGCPPAVEP
jgi:TonB family protein